MPLLLRKNKLKKLIILRGLPGAGKSTFAQFLKENLGAVVFEADDYFVGADGVYRFDPNKLKFAHRACLRNTVKAMHRQEPLIVVANTNKRLWEFEEYIEFAGYHGYSRVVLTVCNTHEGESNHFTPSEEELTHMKSIFEACL